MEDVLVLKGADIINERTPVTDVNGKKTSHSWTGYSSSIVTLIGECGINFFLYLKSLNLSKESEILVLPSNHHYYYDGKELKSVKVLINLKKLNLIKHLDMFLNTLVRTLPPNANFIGCFSDTKTMKEDGFQYKWLSGLFSRFINFLDSRTDHVMNRKEVSELLERNGFKTIDMKEMHGLTYFYCKTSGYIFN
jgi:hypothetical protein